MSDEAWKLPHISVIVCTYQRAELLRDCLSSLACQTIPGLESEVLVVDNNTPASSAVQEIVQGLRHTAFLSCPDGLRYVHCSTLGLSVARNAGIAEARGNICCFIDDDAVASPDWLEQIASAFAAHPETGVIGGHTYLQVPQPRPKILKHGLEAYWSQFVTPYQGYTEVEEWSEFPWGANWAARRKALLAIGGFRADYGRHGDDAWGGEELIAAAQIRSQGYRIAVLPQAKVWHHVDRARFTWRHLRRTIVASTLVTGQAQKDLGISLRPVPVKQSLFREVSFCIAHPAIMVLRLAAHIVLTVRQLSDFAKDTLY